MMFGINVHQSKRNKEKSLDIFAGTATVPVVTPFTYLCHRLLVQSCKTWVSAGETEVVLAGMTEQLLWVVSLDVSLEGVSKFSILVFLREDLSEGRLESREGLTDAVESGQESIRRKIQ